MNLQILKMTHEIEVLKLQLKQRDEIIAFMSSSKPIQTIKEIEEPIQTIKEIEEPIHPIKEIEEPIHPIKEIEEPISDLKPIESEPIILTPKLLTIFKRCIIIENTSKTSEEYFKKGYFDDDLNIYQMEINEFIMCHNEDREWKYRKEYESYKNEILGKKTYEQVIESAKTKALKIVHDKGYQYESLEKLIHYNEMAEKRIEKSRIPMNLCTDFYVQLELNKYISDLMSQDGNTDEINIIDEINKLHFGKN